MGTKLSVLDRWREYHLVYHDDRDLLLCSLLRPLARELASGGWIDRFYFIRYDFGGPHIRLRWRWVGEPERPEEILEARAEDFFERMPAVSEIGRDEILATNHALADVDPMIQCEEEYILPNNSIHSRPVSIEIQRYGGLERLGQSLDLFTLSSVQVLQCLGKEFTESRLRTLWARLLVRLAGAMARRETELTQLVGYAPRFFGEDFAPCIAQGDLVYEQQASSFQALVRHELSTPWRDAGFLADFLEAAFRLGQSEGKRPEEDWYIKASHLHMSANRLGVLNADEVYLSHILMRALGDLQPKDMEAWEHLQGNQASLLKDSQKDSIYWHEWIANSLELHQWGDS